MLPGSPPYIRYVPLVAGGDLRTLIRDPQVRGLLLYAVVAVGVVTLWRLTTSDMGIEPAFRETLFNLVSILTGTGFFSGTFPAWGSFGLAVAFILGLIGGASGVQFRGADGVPGATGVAGDFPDAAKWLMTLTMLLGRLGLLAIFVLALPRFWRR